MRWCVRRYGDLAAAGLLPRWVGSFLGRRSRALGAAAGRVRGEHPRWNLSMIIMRPPQHGHGCDSGLGSSVSARLVSAASGCAVDGSSNRRARAMLPARVPLASRP